MAKKKKRKIPTAAEVAERRAQFNREKIEAERQKLMNFLQEKSLKMIFHSALALEAHDCLKPTTHYNKTMKLYGNKFVKELEKSAEDNLLKIYSDKENEEFTANMMSQIEQVIEKMCYVQFADYPLLNKLLDAFLEDKEFWKENIIAQFNRLDADVNSNG